VGGAAGDIGLWRTTTPKHRVCSCRDPKAQSPPTPTTSHPARPTSASPTATADGRMTARRLRALAARALPSAGGLDKGIRQEGHLGRQLDLTLKQLERLQAARKPSSPVVAAVLTGLVSGADIADKNGFVPRSRLADRPDAPVVAGDAVTNGRRGCHSRR